MIPLIALLLGVAATTAASDGEHAWMRRRQLDRLRTSTGLWPLEAWPGSIARRLEWIQQQFGIEAAVMSARVALLVGNPVYSWRSHEHTNRPDDLRGARVAPFLPWFAWRWAQGDVPESLRRVLLDPQFAPKDEQGKHLPYDKDDAYSDLEFLIHWMSTSRPDIFQYTWDQASKAEQAAFHAMLHAFESKQWIIPRGEIIYRYDWENEDGPWTVERHDDADSVYAIRSYLSIPNKTGHGVIDVLKRPDGEPVALIDLRTRYSSQQVVGPMDIKGKYGNSVLEWVTNSDDDGIIQKLKIYLTETWGDVGNWPSFDGVMIAVHGTDDKEELIELLTSHPELFSTTDDHGASRYIAENVHEFPHEFYHAWSLQSNIEPDNFDVVYANIAANQAPTNRLLEWIQTGTWREEGIQELSGGEYEELPGMLRQFVYGDQRDPRVDVTSISGEHDEVMPWEIQVWDVYRSPEGAELEMKVQVVVWFDWDAHQWQTSAQSAGQFRPTPDPSTWETSDEFEDFQFISLVKKSSWGGWELDANALRSLEKEPFKVQGYGTSSLDVALKLAWTFVKEAIEEAEIEDEGWRDVFQETTVASPDPSLQIDDVLEAMEMLGHKT